MVDFLRTCVGNVSNVWMSGVNSTVDWLAECEKKARKNAQESRKRDGGRLGRTRVATTGRMKLEADTTKIGISSSVLPNPSLFPFSPAQSFPFNSLRLEL